MNWKVLCAILLGAILLLAIQSTVNIAAEPARQNPTPTEEPTKRPYVFPTPIFIPTFASATDLPPRGAISTPRALASFTTTPAPAAPITLVPATPTVTRSDIVAAATATPAAEPESDTAGLARAAENALYAMAVVLFLGFLAISITAFLIYRRSQRAEKIAAMKRRLKEN